MNVGAWALRNGTAVVAALLALAVGGLYAATQLPSGMYPEVDFPRIVVVARGGDGPADVFETQVTRPLEQALVTVLGVRRIKARTIRGSTELSLEFVGGTDMWRALQLVQAQLNNARGSLPSMLTLEVERLTPTAFPVVTFNLSGPIDPRDLKDLADLVVRPQLARVPGVGQVRVLGGDVREIEVVLDPASTSAARLRPSELANRIRDAVGFGAVGRMQQDGQLLTAVVSGEVLTPQALEHIPIDTLPGGQMRTLSSLAKVFEGAADRTNGVGGPHPETVLISVSRAEGASTPAVVHGVIEAANEAAKSFAPGVAIEAVYDQASLVDESVASVRDAILMGVILCLVVLGISLKDVRAGLVAASAVPLVLAASFLAMNVFHQTLNMMSLGGMAVSIGLVIDDAIIVVEAIMHRLERGENARDAAREGTSEMAAAVIGTTVTTVIVFVPLTFVAGLVGDFFTSLATTLSAAVVLSLVVSLTALPVFAAKWLRPHAKPPSSPWLQVRYGQVANWGARHRWFGPVSLAVAVAGCLAVATVVPTGFLPSMDEGAFVLDYFLPAGTSLEQTVLSARKIERVLASTPEVQSFSRRTGAELGPVAATLLNRGDIMVRLKADRKRSGEEVMAGLRARVEQEIPEARYEFVQVLQDVLNDLSGAPRPFELKFFGTDRAQLEKLSFDASARLEHIDGLVDLYNGVEPATASMVYTVNREAAARLGRTVRDVNDEMQAGLAGTLAGSLRRFDRLIDIRVRYPDSVRFDPASVAELPLVFAGGWAPLRSVAQPVRTAVASVLNREGLQPVMVVTAGIEGRDPGSVMKDVNAALQGLQVPNGFRMELGGVWASQQQTSKQFGLVAFFGVMLVLLVLIAQFRAVRPALAVLLTVPFALFGALVTLWVTQTALNASSLMGCVLLVGLEVKSGILLLEVAQAQAAAGHTYVEALALAAQRRIRPIMMTATATMFSVLPLALGLGAGSEIQQPLAVAVLGGIALSKFMTLAALPSLAAALAPRSDR